MRKHDAIALLLKHADELRSAGVAHVSIFGSVARDQGGPDSDLDLVIDGPPEKRVTLFTMARAERLLERIFGCKIDLTAQEGLDRAPNMKQRIAADLTPVF